MINNYVKFGLSIVALLMGFGLPKAHAQSRDSLLAIYNNQTIHTFGNVYMKGNKRLSFRELGNEFETGSTRDLYLKSKKTLSLSRILSVVATATLVGSIILRKNDDKGGVALLVVGIGLNLGNGRLRKKSTELVDQAIWQRNKEILFNVH